MNYLSVVSRRAIIVIHFLPISNTLKYFLTINPKSQNLTFYNIKKFYQKDTFFKLINKIFCK